MSDSSENSSSTDKVVGASWKSVSAHFGGKTTFVDDIPMPENGLYAAVVVSPVAHGRLKKIEIDQALTLSGVVTVITAEDIPGVNQIGDIVPDELLLADNELKFLGKAVALVVATTETIARRAASLVRVICDTLEPVFDVKVAYEKGLTFGDERQFKKGDPSQAFKEATWVVEGECYCPAQEHLYFETQTALSIPFDGNRIKIMSATQNPSLIQKFAAKVLGLPMNQIEVEVPRLGGAFGGKEEQAKPWALLTALAAFLTQRPVKLTLSRQEDMHYTGKRHPYYSRYRIAANDSGLITVYEVQFLQDGGAVADLSTAVLERTIFHATNAYQIPNVNVKAVSCRTNHPSNTAFRGFGAPQAIFTLESAIDQLAERMNKPRWKIQRDNLLQSGYEFDYGMSVETDALQTCWDRLFEQYGVSERLHSLASFNEQSERYKKNLALTPLCFGISFTATHLNQASVTVNVYTDGSVGVAISSVEMGQGVAEKLREVVGRCFGLSRAVISIDYTNSSKTANMSPTAASVGSDLSGMAAIDACEKIRSRLNSFITTLADVELNNLPAQSFEYKNDFVSVKDKSNNQVFQLGWQELITQAYFQRINLCEHSYYATPELYFDRAAEQGKPFAYHVYGVSVIEATVDSVLGTYQVDKADVVYDLGNSLDRLIDQGQMEGGLVQGIGYTTMEEVLWDDSGKLLTDSFATYKIPDLLSSPLISVTFIESESNRYGPFSAKAIGEPPFLLGVGAYFAVIDCIRTVNPKAQLTYRLPITPERVLTSLYPE